MPKKVANVIVSCTKRKTLTVDNLLRIGPLQPKNVDDLVAIWTNRLQEVEGHQLRADRLYSGDHWKVAKSLIQIGESRGVEVKLWICSAGYGLVPICARLKSYSATFSRHDSDSLVSKLLSVGTNDLSSWWEGLSEWEGPSPGMPRSFESLCESFQNSPTVFVASSDYINAVAGDLTKAKKKLSDPRLMLIISSGPVKDEYLANSQVTVNSKLQQTLGGALISLNIRTARYILQNFSNWPIYADDTQRLVSRLIENQPELDRVRRLKMSDPEIVKYINTKLMTNPGASASELLRCLRDDCLACEQKRFHSLFKTIKGVIR